MKLKILKYVHDCGCVVKTEFEAKYCDEVLLDSYHKRKHKCNVKGVNKKLRLNSLACEQLWSIMDRSQPVISHFQRRHYRCFLKHDCLWRNSFVHGSSRSDVNPVFAKRRQKTRDKKRRR